MLDFVILNSGYDSSPDLVLHQSKCITDFAHHYSMAVKGEYPYSKKKKLSFQEATMACTGVICFVLASSVIVRNKAPDLCLQPTITVYVIVFPRTSSTQRLF